MHAPARVAMLQRVPETLTAEIEVQLVCREHGGERLIFEGQGRHAAWRSPGHSLN